MSDSIRIPTPFLGGKVTELADDELTPDEAADLQNAIFRDATVMERNGYALLSADNILASGGALVDAGYWYDESAPGWRLVQTDGGQIGMSADKGGGLQLYAAALSVTGNDGGWRIIAEYAGETILAAIDDDGDGVETPLRRWAGVDDDEVTSGTGTFSVVSGEKRATGSGSNFDPHLAVGCYLGTAASILPASGLWRVASIADDTNAGLFDEPDLAVSAVSVDPSALGVIGLKVLVTDLGVASHTSSSTTLTGKGTAWNSDDVPGHGRVRAGDVILRAEGDALANSMFVTSVSDDQTLSVAANGVGAFTDERIVVLRYAVGDAVTVHDNRLWISGAEWAGDTLYYSPAGYQMGKVLNGARSPNNDAARAAQLFTLPIPNPTAEGRITGHASHRSGLFVGRTDRLYIVRGSAPSLQVDPVYPIACAGPRAIIAYRDSVFVAGRDGIWEFRGPSSMRELTAPRRTEWQQAYPTSSIVCQLGAARGRLWATVGQSGAVVNWVYDLEVGAWCDFTDDANERGAVPPLSKISSLNPARLFTDEYLVAVTTSTTSGERAPVDLATTFDPDDGDETAIDTGRAPLVGVIPPAALGSSSTFKTCTGVKVLYRLQATSATAAVSCGIDASAYSTEAPALAATGAAPITARVYPSDGNLGQRANTVHIRIGRDTDGSEVRRFSIHEVELLVRRNRARA